MSKILLLLNVYPIPNNPMINSTSVCHYFAKEWVKQGHEVVVIYNYTIFNPLLHFFARFFDKEIANFSATIVNTTRFTVPFTYEMDGVHVYLLPCYKIIPRVLFPKYSIDLQVKRIIDYTNQISFSPDVIVGHFLHPSVEIISSLKSYFHVKTAIVLHGQVKSKNDVNSIQKSYSVIDFWGFRSVPIKKSFESKFGNIGNKAFMCYSGVPEDYISIDSCEKEVNKLSKFIYVGNLIKRKHPLSVIQALHNAYGDSNYSLRIIGSGAEEKVLKDYVKSHNLQDNIKFLGRQTRDNVKMHLLEMDCFIMISESETFGLVYLEAMANGCITIASKNEGMEGIIINGYNGFLCTAGDSEELAVIIKQIQNYSKDTLIQISKNAINTALRMTDSKVASNYVNALLS